MSFYINIYNIYIIYNIYMCICMYIYNIYIYILWDVLFVASPSFTLFTIFRQLSRFPVCLCYLIDMWLCYGSCRCMYAVQKFPIQWSLISLGITILYSFFSKSCRIWISSNFNLFKIWHLNKLACTLKRGVLFNIPRCAA